MPNLSARLANYFWFTPEPIKQKLPQSQQDALNTATTKQFQVTGCSAPVEVFEWGESDKRILLVHGWSGRAAQLYPFVQPLVESGYKVLAVDAPAHGNNLQKQTTLFQVSDTLKHLSDTYNGFTAVLTHSFGGMCVAHALTQGFKTGKAVFISPPQSGYGLLEKFQQRLLLPDLIKQKLADMMHERFGHDVWDIISTDNNIRQATIPGLVIHDNEDMDVPVTEGKAIADAWPNARYIETNGLGHRRILKDQSVIKTVTDFLD